ncbi:phenylalanine--tRNA ligase subunit beta [Actinomycetospora cinnamomea]|uniref:Phenylalanine--tRNA ligase beta subunit n=1 Tax=Actinomycetospora cinnamomea TaxID=663609 RepID=A0A2U1F9J0_9PSEU|nr:phenylalanine--tRNA ligase subunit beta [Actinomycetospora cinnamomea]PVZ08855.1 phenylalanyl-tRNA synthetase beta subunit [Actinomycetospora cinnamomea]
MRVPVSWLLQHVDLPPDGVPSADAVGEALIRVGLEVEDVAPIPATTGPLVVGRVRSIEELTEYKKPIRYCRVDVGPEHGDTGGDAEGEGAGTRGIVCGATNFVEGDLVVVALPGAVLPGDFAIAARTTYGHVSDGMICALDELGLGDDHSGILVLPPGTADPGDDATALLGLDDAVLDIAVTPDRGYCLSVRGLARELACALDAPYGDPALLGHDLPAADGDAWPVRLEPESACRRFVARRVTDLDPTAPSPWWMRRRLLLCGVRPISLAVDVTNYVMLELGQPMHAYDASAVRGDIVVRRAAADEKITTLDDVQRALDPDDVVITDESGPIGLAGVMGGGPTEVGAGTSDVLLEAGVWDPPSVARTARRHRLPSEAARRYEREVDPAVARAATDRAAWLLAHYGGATVASGVTDEGPFSDPVPTPAPVLMALDLPDRVAGRRYERGAVVRRLSQIGCGVEVAAADPGDGGAAGLRATPPTWRPDLTRPADLVEEVLRLEGYDGIPSELPAAHPGTGLTLGQRRRRQVSRALADAGYDEVLPSPFVAPSVFDALGLDADDPRRRALRLANPLDADRALMATTLLPGLLDAVVRNVSRGLRDLALYQVGQVVRPGAEEPGSTNQAPVLPVDSRPDDAAIAEVLAGLPDQPLRVGAVLAGAWDRAGWWGPGRAADWADAIEAARLVGRVYGADLEVAADRHAPWHPGRCAALRLPDGTLVGHAGELHPKVLETLGLPARTCAMELELDRLPLVEVRPSPAVSPFPPVLLDVALVLDADVPAASVATALRDGGGDLLEDVRLFDVYTGAQVGEGKRSLAFALRLRAPDRTLTLEEASARRDAAVATAAERHGARLR